MDSKAHRAEFLKREEIMEDHEKMLFEKLLDFHALMETLLDKLKKPNPNVREVIEGFNPLEIKAILESAAGYVALMDIKNDIEAQGKEMMELLGILDVSNSENPGMVRKVANEGPASPHPDRNHVDRDVLIMELKRFFSDEEGAK